MRPPVSAAYGISIKAPRRVLANTIVGVEKLSRASAMKKYGRPQNSPANEKRIRPLVDTSQW
jgi:hypothetical protein